MRRPSTPLLPLTFICAALLAGCATMGTYRADTRPPDPLPDGPTAYTVFLVGNTADLTSDAVLAQLRADAQEAGDASAVVFLGDTAPAGGPERIATALRGASSRIVLVPGDRDGDLGVVQRQLAEALGVEVEAPRDVEPVEIDLLESLRLVVLDTPTWLRGDASVDVASGVVDLEQLVEDRDDEQLIIVGHHPLRSNGASGGFETPLGGIATLGVGALLGPTVGTSAGDLAAPRYRKLRSALEEAFGEHERLVYAAAHDRSLQAFVRGVNGGRSLQTFLVSGSGGGDADATVGGYGATFAASRPGYWRLRYYPDGQLWAEAVAVDASGAADTVYREALSDEDPELAAATAPDVGVDTSPAAPVADQVTLTSDAGFETGPFSNDGLTRVAAGAGYRDAWRTPVAFEVLDLNTEAGGLTPLRRGGGNQTTSLRVEGSDGHVYDLRLLEKGGTGGLPAPLRSGFAGDLVLDLRSAALPYASVVTGELAESAGVIAPKARVVYVPDSPRLGRFRSEFGNRLALFEVRPDDDMSDLDGWEGVTDVISSGKLREELTEDQDHRVDQEAFFRARLLDLVIGDWDRHAGQWRWAAFEPVELDPTLTGDEATRGKIYQPVPRDRDWAFYDLGGLVQRALYQFDRRYQPFGPDYGSLVGLTNNSRGQDRRFMSRISYAGAMAIAEDLQSRLTDDAIDRAVAQMPREIEAVIGDEWRTALRGRRDALQDAARHLYEMAAAVVPVVGSDEREAFLVEPAPAGVTVTVRSFKRGEMGAELYRRTFDRSETGEIQLYGRGGRDRFDIAPDADAIKLRIISGSGDDQVTSAESDVSLYDTPDGVEVTGAIDSRVSADPGIHRFDENARVVSDTRFRPVIGARATDGAILGGALTVTTHGFRKEPFATQHLFSADVATATWGVRGSYQGRFHQAVGPFDLGVDLSAAAPRNVRNFYGLGNGTADVSADVVRLDLARGQADLDLVLPVGNRFAFSFGPTIRYADPSRDDLNLGPLAALPESAYEPQAHAGGQAGLMLSTVDIAANPRQGVRLDLGASGLAPIGGEAEAYGAVEGTLTAFVPLRVVPQATLALRAGADHRIGTFPFFDSAVLGQSTSIRGYRRERFSGQTSAFGNAELRLKLFDLSTYLVPFDVGVLGFADAGRVWFPDGASVSGIPTPTVASSDDLNVGLGGGVWFGLLDQVVIVLSAGRSDEGTLVSFGGGFHF